MRPLTRTRKTGEGFSNESGEKGSFRACGVYIYVYIGLYLCVDTYRLFLPYLFGSAKKIFCAGETGGREKHFPARLPFTGQGPRRLRSGGVSSIDQISFGI